MFRQLFSLAAAVAMFAGSASAQLQLNELFVSMSGSDTTEFLEIRGPAGTPLTGYMLCIVEGDGPSNFGVLDDAIDLSAGTIGASGLYTVGNAAVVPAVDQVVPGTQDLFENGTETIYLIQTSNVAYVVGLLGTDIRTTPGSGTQTVFAAPPAGTTITIVDSAAIIDNVADMVFDNAPAFGPDGTFMPAGIVRCGDAPFSWNAQFLNFNTTTTAGYVDISPTTANPNCGLSTGTSFCPGDGTGTACPCANNSPVGNNEGCLNSLGLGGKLVASGSASLANDTVVLTGTQMPNSSALYFQGTNQQGGGAGATFGDGLRCAGGSITRLGTKSNVAGASQYPAAGDPSVSVRGLVTVPGVRTYQVWYRNAANFCTASTFNLSNGWEITWGS